MIKGGTTVALAVIYDNVLYISNVGDSRVVYCYVDKRTGTLQAYQLSVDHVATNEDEIERLRGLGLDPAMLRKSKRLGMQQNTRSIGDYSIKGGYKDVDIIRCVDNLVSEEINFGGVAISLILPVLLTPYSL